MLCVRIRFQNTAFYPPVFQPSNSLQAKCHKRYCPSCVKNVKRKMRESVSSHSPSSRVAVIVFSFQHHTVPLAPCYVQLLCKDTNFF